MDWKYKKLCNFYYIKVSILIYIYILMYRIMSARPKVVKPAGVTPDELETKIAQELSNIEV